MLLKIVLFTVISGSAWAAADSQPNYVPQFHPDQLKQRAAGAANQVLVLGTPHLRYQAKLNPADLEPLLARLEHWKPQIIAIEALSGAQCDQLRRYGARYADTVKTYCWDPAPAHTATGMDVPTATAEVERLLSSWPTAAQRRQLAASFLAAGDQASALVQWLRLSPDEQHTGEGLDTTLVALLEENRRKHNESFLIAAPLAARLGLDRVYPIDDHSADSGNANEADEKAYNETLQRIWDNPAAAQRKKQDEKLQAEASSGAGVLAMYRAYNQADQAMLVYRSDFGAAMQDRSTQQYGRGYVGYWETRNLRTVSNIREALGEMPGQRALAIVGAAHKGYFEAYLNMMHDVTLVDAQTVLH